MDSVTDICKYHFLCSVTIIQVKVISGHQVKRSNKQGLSLTLESRSVGAPTLVHSSLNNTLSGAERRGRIFESAVSCAGKGREDNDWGIDQLCPVKEVCRGEGSRWLRRFFWVCWFSSPLWVTYTVALPECLSAMSTYLNRFSQSARKSVYSWSWY